MKTNPFSAAGIRQSESRANLNNKPVLNRSKNRIYDSDGEFEAQQDRKETKIYSLEILTLIKKAFKSYDKKTKEGGWISAPAIRRKLNPNKIRMWDAAIGLLVDDVEVKNPLVPHFRYCPRELKSKNGRSTGYSFNNQDKNKSAVRFGKGTE